VRKPNDFSERESHFSRVAEGKERTGRSQGPCHDCDEEEYNEDEEGDELGDGVGGGLKATCGQLSCQAEPHLDFPLYLGILVALRGMQAQGRSTGNGGVAGSNVGCREAQRREGTSANATGRRHGVKAAEGGKVARAE